MFEKNVNFSYSSVSILRSIIGMNLHSMCCISKKSECSNCIYSGTCIYSLFFESFVNKDNNILKGINTAPHPYVLSLDKCDNKDKNIVSFNVTLFGKYTDYFPYIYGAFLRAGQKGFGSRRIPFKIADVSIDDSSLILDEDRIITDSPSKIWKWKFKNDIALLKSGSIDISLISPLRFKTSNSYASDINANIFMTCLYRRAKTLCGFYGQIDEDDTYNIDNIHISAEDIFVRWQENNRYSSRQKTTMSLGGLVGDFTLKGDFTGSDLALIEFARLFGAGKNTNFGLGQIGTEENLR